MVLWHRKAAMGLIMSGLLSCVAGLALAQSGPGQAGPGAPGAPGAPTGQGAAPLQATPAPQATVPEQSAPTAPAATVAATQDKVVVVELFTSQGCSYCPPADSFLSMLADRDDVIALALHVDYWDYIGWEDTFGSASFTKRQKAYAREAGRRAVYTPQMIIGGVDEVMGNHPMDVADLIRAHRNTPYPAAIRLERVDADTLRLRAQPAAVGPVQVVLLRYLPQEAVKVKRGENAGKTLTYSNIVTDWTVVGDWDGASALDMTLPATGPAPAVVLMQKKGPGAIVAAARLR